MSTPEITPIAPAVEVKLETPVVETPAVPAAETKAQVKAEVTEVKTEPVVAEPTSKDLLDLAKKEAAYAKKEVQRKAEFQKLAEEKAKLEEKVNQVQSLRESAKKDPLLILKEFGITYDDLTEAVLAGEASKNPVNKEITKLKEEIDSRFKEQELAKQEQERIRLESEKKAAVESFRSEISSFFKENANKYPLTSALHKSIGGSESPEDIIFTAINSHYEATGELLEFSKVADTAEEWFSEQWKELNNKVVPKSVVEVAQVEQPKAVEKPSEPVKTEQPKAVVEEPVRAVINSSAFKMKDRVPSTLTNKLAANKTRIPYQPKNADRQDAIARAVAALEKRK